MKLYVLIFEYWTSLMKERKTKVLGVFRDEEDAYCMGGTVAEMALRNFPAKIQRDHGIEHDFNYIVKEVILDKTDDAVCSDIMKEFSRLV